MVFTRDLSEFYRTNDGEVRAFIVSRIGFFDKDILNDLMQSFYYDLQYNDSLNKYDPSAGMSFSSYVFKIVVWRLRQDAASNKKISFLDLPEQAIETIQDRLNDYIGFLKNTGVSCTGVYEINECLQMRMEGLTTREVPYQYYQRHQHARKNYQLYNDYGIQGITGICKDV